MKEKFNHFETQQRDYNDLFLKYNNLLCQVNPKEQTIQPTISNLDYEDQLSNLKGRILDLESKLKSKNFENT